MTVVITGGGGFIGRRITLALLAAGEIRLPSGVHPIRKISLLDLAAPWPALPDDPRIDLQLGDSGDPARLAAAITKDTVAVFHLAAVVSAEAEADPDKGYRVNLDGTRALLDVCRAVGSTPVVVFASSVAVYGGDAMPAVVGEATALNPQTSYGAQKAIGEFLVNDFTRKGFIDGRALRLPTVVVRPGRPNRAASTFCSSILREPLSGRPAICPVGPEALMPLISPRKITEAFLATAAVSGDRLGSNRVLQLPGLTVSVAAMVDALERAGGRSARALVNWQPDPVIQRIVAGWPTAVDGARALSLGIKGDPDIDEIIAGFISDDLAAQKTLNW